MLHFAAAAILFGGFKELFEPSSSSLSNTWKPFFVLIGFHFYFGYIYIMSDLNGDDLL